MIMPPRSGRGCNGRSDRLPGIVFAVGHMLPAVAGCGMGVGEDMEYEVNQVFESNGKRFQCVLGECEQCAFHSPWCTRYDLLCSCELRKDSTDVRFVEVSK